MANILEGLMQLFTGGGQNQQAPRAPMPAPMQQAQRFAPLPQSGPMPAPMPQLPGGTFSPNRQDTPMPIPDARPLPPPPPPANPNIPANMAQSQNPLMALLSGGNGGRGIGDMIAAAGAGMANIDPRNDDPFSTLGRGMVGASGYYADKRQADAKAEQDSRNFDYKVGQDGIDNARSDAELALRQAANARANKSQDLNDRKTAREIDLLAKTNGVDTKTALAVDNAAMEYAKSVSKDGFDDTIDPEKYKKAYNEKKQELFQQLGMSSSENLSSNGLSKDGGLSNIVKGTVAEDANGKRIVFDGSTWVSQ